MAGLLSGDYSPDPLAQGLLGLGAALMQPRQLGGGIGPGLLAFNQQAQAAQAMRRQMEQDAERTRMQRERADMDRERFGFDREQFTEQRAARERQQQVMGQVREQLARDNPNLLPLFDVNPQEAMKRLFPNAEAYTLSPGAERRGPNNEVLAANPRAENPPPPTELEKLQALRAQLPPNDPRVQEINARIAVLNYRQPGAVSNVTMIGEREESKVVGAGMGKTFLDIQNAGMQARGKVNNLTRLESLLSGYETGKLTPLGKEIASYAASVGINIDKNLGNKEAAESLSNELALQARNPSGGAGMPGAMSDRDREFLQNMVPNLAKSTAGNRTIIETQRRLAKREMDVARIASEYRAKRGSLDPQFYQELQQWSDANPLFADMPSVPVTSPDGRTVTGTIGAPGSSGWSIKRVP